MAYDEGVAQRVREAFEGREGVAEKKMFGGLCFMQQGHMCVGIVDEVLMARVGPERYEEALAKPHARVMDFTGRTMKGFVFVDPPGFEDEVDLEAWIALCERFITGLPPR